jgi:SAM-dependent methyltransferase
MNTRQQIKRMLREILPLEARKRLCILFNRQKSIREETRSWWTSELLRDFREADISGYHKFLWTHHLAYALPYVTSARFGTENMAESRRIFFSDLIHHLEALGVDAKKEISSALEIGCSLGYQLRYLETDLTPSATELIGIDIDGRAISEGKRFFKKVGSKVKLIRGDMMDLAGLIGRKSFDLVFSTGVLMYLRQNEAARVVESMLRRGRIVVALTGLAHPETDNSLLRNSVVRSDDQSFIHNIDSMVRKTGAEIVGRRWEGKRMVQGHTLYSVFAKGIGS